MEEGLGEHVSERFARLSDLYRRPDGSVWGGQDLETATGGAVKRSYVSNLKKGRIGSPGLDKLAAMAWAMGFPPALWFGGDGEARGGKKAVLDGLLVAALEDKTVRAILEEALKLGSRDRRLLLGIACQISPSPAARPDPLPGSGPGSVRLPG